MEEVVANMMTKFTTGDHSDCRLMIYMMRPEEAALVAACVYGAFITTDKVKAREWDAFLRRGVRNT